jgi:protein SCO1/2
MSRVIGPMLRILIVALVLLAGATVWMSNLRLNPPEPTIATELPTSRALPAVAFTDQLGRDFAVSDLEGHFTLMFFGFTNCPDICPLTMQTLANVETELSAKNIEPPRVILVSVDPARDTPEQLRRYLANFSESFIGVTAPQDALQPLASTLGVTIEHHQHADGDAYNVAHNSTIYVLGPEAEWIALFSSPHDAASIATDFVRLQQRYEARQAVKSASR